MHIPTRARSADRSRARLPALLVGAALVLAGCGADDDPADTDLGEDVTSEEPAAVTDDGPEPTEPDEDATTDPATDELPTDDDAPTNGDADPTNGDHGDHGHTHTDGDADGEIVVTAADDGDQFTTVVDQPISLRLDPEGGWDVRSEDESVVVVTQVDHLVDPGYAEWLLEPVDPGWAVIRAMPGPGVELTEIAIDVTVDG